MENVFTRTQVSRQRAVPGLQPGCRQTNNGEKVSDETFGEIVKQARMKLHVDTSGYSYKEWKGGFYPATLSVDRMLEFYASKFASVEINYTSRNMPTVELMEKWRHAVAAQHFQFVLKAPLSITHFRRLLNTEDVLTEFFYVVEFLGSTLGPVLFQLPDNFRKDATRLRDFLELLPPHHQCAFEFRHQSWFDDEILTLLRANDVALCIAETENELETPFASTAAWGYVRLRRNDYSDNELKAWLKQIESQSWSDVFVFFRHEDEGKGPRMATRLLELAR